MDYSFEKQYVNSSIKHSDGKNVRRKELLKRSFNALLKRVVFHNELINTIKFS